MVAVAIAGAAVVGGAATLSAAGTASKTAKDNAAANNALQSQVYGENKATLAPYVGAGNAATPVIQGLLGIGGDAAASAKAFDLYKGSTEYMSRLNQGQNSVLSGLGARGLLDSGAAQKSLLKYGQTFASNEFGNYLGNLTQQQGVGLTAASAQAGVGQNYANAVGQNNTNAANTSANAALASAGAINGILNGAVNAYGYSQGMGSSYGGGSASPTWGQPGHEGAWGIRGSDGIY